MRGATGYVFKVATEPDEFAQIHTLNYETFVEEIPQHAPDGSRRLVDRFHPENTYLVCKDDGRVVGMMALRGNRPFSLDHKLPDLDRYLPAGRRPCEIRLLAVDPARRGGRIFVGLVRLLVEHGRRAGYDLAVLSGVTRQRRLYANLGCVPFGPEVGTAEAVYQPMYVTLERWDRRGERLGPLCGTTSFVPGPVSISTAVRRALAAAPISHRSADFASQLQRVRAHLTGLTGARFVQVLVGTGTLGNDVVAGQLALAGEPGLIIAAGEFGERLADHATRAGLRFDALRKEWGAAWSGAAVDGALAARPQARWLWAVHCETSTGVMLDLAATRAACAARGVRLCLDSCSGVGTLPVDLSGVYLASSVSGKALGGFPGLALVFHNHPVTASPRLPRYLDLGVYAEDAGVPYTHSSNLLAALEAALEEGVTAERFAVLASLSGMVRARLRALGLPVVGDDAHASPAIVSVALPAERDSVALGECLDAAGFPLSYRSGYLVRRNWVQISLMGAVSAGTVERLLTRLQLEVAASPA